MENNNTFKQQYKMGLDLLKEDIEKCKNDKLYSPITPYFEYPISLMEQEVKGAIDNNSDTEEYYIENFMHRPARPTPPEKANRPNESGLLQLYIVHCTL